MNSEISERLKSFRMPRVAALPEDHFVVVQLEGVDFDSFFVSPAFEFSSALDPQFGKLMVQTTSLLLGAETCGRYGYTELTQLSLLLDHESARQRFEDATDLQNYLVGLASARMSLLLAGEALFLCRMYAFPSRELVLAYFTWRQQEAYMCALDGYCSHVLLQDETNTTKSVSALLADLGPREKEEILRQNALDYGAVPSWQRFGVGVHLDGSEVRVVTELPRDENYRAFVEERL